MTREEARGTMLLEVCPACEYKEVSECVEEDCEIYLAIKALETQIPKRVAGKYLPWGAYMWRGRCPTCGFSTPDVFDFCPKCGQALDWSEKNEKDQSGLHGADHRDAGSAG